MRENTDQKKICIWTLFTQWVKVNYCCTQNVASIIKSHKEGRKQHKCPLDGKCRAGNIAYKCVASVNAYPNKVYLGTAEGDIKKRCYNHWMSFNNEGYSTDTTLSIYIWGIKKKFKIILWLQCSIIKSIPAYSNISKKCHLCLHEKLETLNYPDSNKLLNEGCGIYCSKYLLSNYKSND